MKRWFSDIRQQEIGHGPCLAPGEVSGVLRGWRGGGGASGNLVVSLNQEDGAEDSGRQNLQSRGLGRRQNSGDVQRVPLESSAESSPSSQ